MSVSLLCVLGVVFVALALLLVHSRVPLSPRAWRTWLGGAAMIAAELGILATVQADPWDPGHAIAPGLVVDGLSNFVDVASLVLVAGLVLAGIRGHALPRVAPALAFGAFGVALVGHSGDLITWVVGLELAALGAVVAVRPSLGELRRGLIASLFVVLGAALMFGATAGVGFEELPTRVASVFNRWGGAQRYAVPLPGEASLPSAFVHEVVEGMAPAALLFAGIVILTVGLLVRGLIPDAPRRGVDADPQTLGARSAVAVGFALRRLPVLAALLRLHVALMHTPRLVNEPYGWNGALPVVALVTVFLGGWVALRSRSIASALGGFLSVPLGFAVASVATAANYHGHRAWVDRPVSSSEELEWSTALADHASGTVLLWWAAAALGLVVVMASLRAARLDGDDVVDLEAIGRVHPWIGGAAVLGVWSLVGGPLTLGGAAAWSAFTSLVEHTSLWRVAAVMIVALVPAWLAALRWSVRVMAGTRDGPSLGAVRRSSGAVAIVGALLLVGAGVSEATARTIVRGGAGLSFGIGTERRAEWMQSRAQTERGAAMRAPAPRAGPAPDDANQADRAWLRRAP